MEYKVLTPKDKSYPEKLKERLGKDSPEKIYYSGKLELLDEFTMGFLSADASGGLDLMEMNQLLFTIRHYEFNLIGACHSVLETELFRLSLFRENMTTTLVSAKGLQKETYESFLLDRFYPPLHHFPEEEEYARRAKAGELLMLSVTEPTVTRSTPQNVKYRNFILALLSDVLFIPYAEKNSKTLSVVKKVLPYKVPIFTTTLESNSVLHKLGIPGLTRKNVGEFLEKLGAKKSPHDYTIWHPSSELIAKREKISKAPTITSEPTRPAVHQETFSFLKETSKKRYKP